MWFVLYHHIETFMTNSCKCGAKHYHSTFLPIPSYCFCKHLKQLRNEKSHQAYVQERGWNLLVVVVPHFCEIITKYHIFASTFDLFVVKQCHGFEEARKKELYLCRLSQLIQLKWTSMFRHRELKRKGSILFLKHIRINNSFRELHLTIGLTM